MHPFDLTDEEAADMKRQLTPLLTIVLAKKADGEMEDAPDDMAEDDAENAAKTESRPRRVAMTRDLRGVEVRRDGE